MLKIGLTGGTGSGKSEALKCFRRFGAQTIDLDVISHQVCLKGRPAYRAVIRAFGAGVLGRGGELDRKVLARLVFTKPALRKRLEKATHPWILREMKKRLSRMRHPVVVVDVPLLFEVGMADEFDLTVVVSCLKRSQIKRIMARDGLSPQEALGRLKAQMPLRRKSNLADIVLTSEGGIARFKRTVSEYQHAFKLIASARN